jgi:DNA-binding transcriptional LysR family regulator
MEMTQIRYFLALRKECSFTRAARRCGVAQPSLTRAIRNLEQELGEPLFERRPDGAKLTAFGEEVAPYFEAIWRCVAEIKREPRRISANDRRSAREIGCKLGWTARMNGSPRREA